MQGQRGIIGSLPESLDFDHVSTPGNTVVSQQIFWNELRDSPENGLADFMDLNDGASAMGQERQAARGWNVTDPSSSTARNEMGNNGPKEPPWPSSAGPCVGTGSRLEDNRCAQTHALSFDSGSTSRQYIQGHNSDTLTQNLNLNTGFGDHSNDNYHLAVDPNGYKTSGNDSARPSCPPGSFVPARGGRLMLGDNEDRPGCSMDACRQSCKRKSIEGTSAQSSVSGSSSFFHSPEGSSWSHVPGRYDSNSSLGMSVSSQSGIPRLGLGLRSGSPEFNFSAPTAIQPEGSHRSFRLRINPSNQESLSAPYFPNVISARHSHASVPHQTSRHLSSDPSDPGSSVAVVATVNQHHQNVLPVSSMQHNVQSLRWSDNPAGRDVNSLPPISLSDRDEVNHRSVPRNLLDHPISVPANELRAIPRNLMAQTVGVGTGSNVASSSRSGSGLGSHPLTGAGWIPTPHVSSRSSRRLAEYVRRSLFSSNVTESGGQGDLRATLHLRPSSSEEPAVTGNSVHHRSFPRPSWVDRQSESLLGIPYPVRNFTAGNEGRRQVSEQIRNVLDIMRRGEGLRFEDVMILDQSVFFGVADIHDRHRDMRLDVDNMSYEELLALEERIGNVSTGLTEESIFKSLKQQIYSDALKTAVGEEPCCVCQENYSEGENLGALDCGHNFHTDCIKQWLMLKNWCPICKTTGLA